MSWRAAGRSSSPSNRSSSHGGMLAPQLWATGRVAAQGDDVTDAQLPVVARDRVHLFTRGTDAGEVGRRSQRRLLEDAFDGGVGALASRAAGAIGDRDEPRLQGSESLDRGPQG